MNCCNQEYQLCKPLSQCFETLIIYLPSTFEGSTVDLCIGNGAAYGAILRDLDVSGDLPHVVIDVPSSELPDGFFSPYGGPYAVQFLGGSDLITFQGMDGTVSDTISFTITNSQSTGVEVVNAFYANAPEPYV